MLYVEGKFIDVHGVGKQTWLWKVPDERKDEVAKAFKKTQQQPFLAVGTDEEDRFRVIYVERLRNQVSKQLPNAGLVYCTCFTQEGSPIKIVNFLVNTPKEVRDEAITRLATMHLADLPQTNHLPQ